MVDMNDSQPQIQEAPPGTQSARGHSGRGSHSRPGAARSGQQQHGAPAKRAAASKKAAARGTNPPQATGPTKNRKGTIKGAKAVSRQPRGPQQDEAGREFRGSFQNKGHRLWAPSAVEETPGEPLSK